MNTANRIGYASSSLGTAHLQSVNPTTRAVLPEQFPVATLEEVDAAVAKAAGAFQHYRLLPGREKAAFLRAVAEEIEALGMLLIDRAMQESGLPEARLLGERGRTCGQLRLFADFLEEGSWVNAIIETALPERQPIPRPDIRSMLVPVGPVAVFTASNFPLAFSTAGGDTAAALAAGCPVIVKAHPAHLGTNALVTDAIQQAARRCNLPDGVFSSLNDAGSKAAIHLVQHPLLKAVAFTGSHHGGMALSRAAQERTEPIPVFAEMGSINPIFLLPGVLGAQTDALATTVAASVTLGVGQFCTNPGVIIAFDDPNSETFIKRLGEKMQDVAPATMLNKGIYENYERMKDRLMASDGVVAECGSTATQQVDWKGTPALASVPAERFLAEPGLREEVFGPFTLVVKCADRKEMEAVATNLAGQLTATIMAEAAELEEWSSLVSILQEKAGRLILNGMPTGVEVGHAMQHGGPFPATTDSRFSSVGTQSIRRFVRPLAFQGYPSALLPDALKDGNPLGIHRFFNGKWGRE